MEDFDKEVSYGWVVVVVREKTIEGRKTVPRELGDQGRFWDGRNVKAEEEREGGVRVVWGKKREAGESRDREGKSGNTRRD